MLNYMNPITNTPAHGQEWEGNCGEINTGLIMGGRLGEFLFSLDFH
jgi:hypothetical protein